MNSAIQSKPLARHGKQRQLSRGALLAWLALLGSCSNGSAASWSPTGGSGGSAPALGGTGGVAGAVSSTAGAVGLAGGGTAGQGGSPVVNIPLDANGCPIVPPLKLARVATLTQTAVLLVQAPADPRLFVAERLGRILIVKDGAVAPTPFLDIRSSIAPLETERGLLSIALHPAFATNRRFYVVYTRAAQDPQTPELDNLGDLVLAEGTASLADPNVADPTLKVLRTVRKAERFHNGGMAAFGPDGMLYVSTGEDGRQYDLGLIDSLQELDNPMGKMLRIDVDNPTTRPAGNFPNGDVHVWSYGLRNPWRWSFDRLTGDMYIGDVGEKRWEELIFEPKGMGQRNYGWPITEGNHCFPDGDDCDKNGITPPLLELEHSGDGTVEGQCVFDDIKLVDCNRAILGGYVYRGTAVPELGGRYFYGENVHNQVRSLIVKNGSATCQVDHTVDLASAATPIQGLVSFSQDAQGEVYLLDIFANVYRIERE